MSVTYRGPEVSRLARITYRQLDYWARTGILTPSIQSAMGPGSRRFYSQADAHVALALGWLAANSIGPSSDLAQRVALHIREHGLTGRVSDRTGFLLVDLDALEDPFVQLEAKSA